MSPSSPDALRQRLDRHGQAHLLRWWSELSESERRRLAEQIEAIDFADVRRVWEKAREEPTTPGESADSPAARAQRASPPGNVVRLPKDDAERARWADAARVGEAELAAGRVGVIIVAGGEGTRLQFPHPKGMYPIGPVTRRSLYQWLAEQILARSLRAGCPIPVYVMTSDRTHEESIAHFAEHRWFGLPADSVHFFRQGTMPVVSWEDGSLLMSSRGEVAVSPDGHGGLLIALDRHGLLQSMRARGVERLFYMQVDNPTVIACEPAFLGLHVQSGSELSTKVVAKQSAAEKMGVVCDVDGCTQIVEYSDMPADVAEKAGPDGQLVHWAGNTAIHVFDRSFLERLAGSADSLPFHRARKHVPYMNSEGALIEPKPPADPPNACKFERFIFDALLLARKTLVVEGDRDREFHPLKDIDGANGPDSVRAALTEQARAWLRARGVPAPEGWPVEISPIVEQGADDTGLRRGPTLQSRVREESVTCVPGSELRGWVLD